MAGGISGNLPPAHHFKQTPSTTLTATNLTTVMANTGSQTSMAKANLSTEETEGDGGDLELSDAAQQALQAEEAQSEFVEEHAGELASQSGLTQTADADSNSGIERKRGQDRDEDPSLTGQPQTAPTTPPHSKITYGKISGTNVFVGNGMSMTTQDGRMTSYQSGYSNPSLSKNISVGDISGSNIFVDGGAKTGDISGSGIVVGTGITVKTDGRGSSIQADPPVSQAKFPSSQAGQTQQYQQQWAQPAPSHSKNINVGDIRGSNIVVDSGADVGEITGSGIVVGTNGRVSDLAAPATVALKSPTGVHQVVSVEDHTHLTHLDDPDYHDPCADVPEANLEAADRVLQTQLSGAKGVRGAATLKTDDKVQAAASQIETAAAPKLVEPMDIRDAGNHNKFSQPTLLELSDSDHDLAKHHAANQLASGGFEQEALMTGGPGTKMEAAAIGVAGVAAAATVVAPKPVVTQRAPIQVSPSDANLAQLQQGVSSDGAELGDAWETSKKSAAGLGIPPEQAELDLTADTKQAQVDAQAAGQKIAPELATSRALSKGGVRTIKVVASHNKAFESLMNKHMRNGTLNSTSLKGELDKRITDLKKQGDPRELGQYVAASDACQTMANSDKFEADYQKLAATGADMSKVRTPLSDSRLKALDDVSSGIWDKSVSNHDVWKKAGLSKDDVAGIGARVNTQALKMCGGKENSPLYDECSSLAMADELGKLSTQRLSPEALAGQPLDPEKAAALQQLKSGSQQYLDTRWPMLQFEGVASPVETSSTSATTVVSPQTQMGDAATQLAKTWQDGVAACSSVGYPPSISAELLDHYSKQAEQQAAKSGETLTPELATAQGMKLAGFDNMRLCGQTDPQVSQMLMDYTSAGKVDYSGFNSELQSAMQQAQGQGDQQTVFKLQDISRSLVMMEQSDKYEAGYNQAKAAGTDLSTLPTPLTALKHDSLEQASNDSWSQVGNKDLWTQAGFSPQDIQGVNDRTEKQAMGMVNGNANDSRMGESTYLSMAEQMSQLAAQRLDAMKANWASQNEAQQRALETLKSGGETYVSTRLGLLEMDGHAKPLDAATIEGS